MLTIDYNSFRSVKSFNQRVRFLVMHYTAVNFTQSITALTSSVSAHYLVPDPTDPSYIAQGFKDVRVFNLVDEKDRAWHAGVSQWGNRSNLNDCSIGIENVNLAQDNHGVFTFPPYQPEQIDAIIALSQNILSRYPDITPTNVVAHSDISVGRKSDPGPQFPWKKLHQAGVGAWYDACTQQKYLQQFKKTGLPTQTEILKKLSRYGYAVPSTVSDSYYQQLLRAFQLHFRPTKYDGKLDIGTASILYALVEKYFP